MRLHGKKVLVVGASSGIGLACARLFASEGAKVCLAARRKDRLEEVAGEIGRGACVVAGDVSDPQSCEGIVGLAVQAMGGLDAMVYAAGVCQPRRLREMSRDDFSHCLDVNLVGNFVVAKAAALHMESQDGGSIVNISSELAHTGMRHYVHYCASKAGVVGLTKALAAEMAPKVRVNTISPGPVDTPMMDAELQWFGGTPKVRDAAISRVPLRRFATAEEVAKTALFLIADAHFATGSVVSLDGGTTAVSRTS